MSAASPKNLTITFTGTGSPQTVALPKPDGVNPVDYTMQVRSMYLNGGFWFLVAGVNTFCPYSQILSIVAT
jgi:hypothetical protein